MKNRIPTFENFQYNLDTQLYELSENSTLYHRSFNKYKVGDIIHPSVGKKGTHWSEDDVMEIGLEEFRKENYPNRPSRANAVYSSVIPRSRFFDKGYLYVVKPIGNFFMTDSMLIDQLNEDLFQSQKNSPRGFLTLTDAKKYPKVVLNFLSWYNMKKYWEGVKSLPKKRWGDLEILADQAQVVQVIEDAPGTLRPGMDIVITENDKLMVTLSIYNNEDKHKEGRTTLPPAEIKKVISYIEKNIINGKVKEKSYDKDVYEISGYLRKGAKLQISYIRSSNTKNIQSTWDDNKPMQKYQHMMFDFYVGKKLYRRADQSPLFRFETSYSGNNIYDWGTFMKKV
ncbi:MAG TPA: hypothetical protein P5509_06885 [Bacteroidales bacterium]|nr:hypothetical protein [Bacteroidales bacterium]